MLLSNENLANQNMLGGEYPCQYFLCRWIIGVHAIMQFIIPNVTILKFKKKNKLHNPDTQKYKKFMHEMEGVHTQSIISNAAKKSKSLD